MVMKLCSEKKTLINISQTMFNYRESMAEINELNEKFYLNFSLHLEAWHVCDTAENKQQENEIFNAIECDDILSTNKALHWHKYEYNWYKLSMQQKS